MDRWSKGEGERDMQVNVFGVNRIDKKCLFRYERDNERVVNLLYVFLPHRKTDF